MIAGAQAVQGERRPGVPDGARQALPRQRGAPHHVLQMLHHQPSHQQQVPSHKYYIQTI